MRSPTLLTTLTLALALPAAALAREETYLLQTQESADVPALCPDGDNIRLGAYTYAPRTRAEDALVVRELGTPVGTAVGCGRLTSIAPFDFAQPAPFAMSFAVGDLTVTAHGYCVVADRSFPLWPEPKPLLLVGCTLAVDPDPAQGIERGSATSSSVFLPAAIPGYETGSFWTLHLVRTDAAATPIRAGQGAR